MSKIKNKKNQWDLYEFTPSEEITHSEIIELAKMIRIGVGHEIFEKSSDNLKKHFNRVEDNKKES